jgi:hypothetical protein
MRCPKCHCETPAEAHNCPSCNLPTPKGRLAVPKKGAEKKGKSVEKRKIDFAALLPKMRGVRIISWVILLALLGGSGFFVYWYAYATSETIAPQPALQAMHQLRRLPSKEEGKNIEDCLNGLMKKSREAGRLVSYEGWTIKPYERNGYLISFSFDEKEARKSADWVFDPQNKAFTPISELASAVYKEEKAN